MFEISWLKFDLISLISLLSSKKCSSEEPPLTDLSGFFCRVLEPGKFAEEGSVRFVPLRWTNVQSLFVHTQGVFANSGMEVFTISSTLTTVPGHPKAAVLEATFRVVKLTLLTIYRFTATKTVKTVALFVFGAYKPLGCLYF